MYLFILESIGTQELLLIGAVALIFLGPRKLPQMAKTIGKTLKEFRSATNEFKETWEREVNFEEEEKIFKTGEVSPTPVPRVDAGSAAATAITAAPEIREIDKDIFDKLSSEAKDPAVTEPKTEKVSKVPASDKRNWL